MSGRIVKRDYGPNKGKHVLLVTTEVEVKETVDVDVDIDLKEFVAELNAEARGALLDALSGQGVTDARAENAYYAFARGDLETVRRFLCEVAGRIA